MKVGQRVKLTIGGKDFFYVISMQSEVKNAIWIKTMRGKKQFMFNTKTLTWNENGIDLSASKMEIV